MAGLVFFNNLPEPVPEIVTAFHEEYRNEMFHRAAEQARGEFRESTWSAFWRTCVQHEPIAEVAQKLELSVGSVYVARSRIIARLRQIVEEYEADHDT